MFTTRFKTTLTLLLLTLVLATAYLIAPVSSAMASSTPDFIIAASPTSHTIERGQAALYTVQVQAVNGFTGTVTLSTSGVPNKSFATFTDASGNIVNTITGSGSLLLTVQSNRTESPVGTSTITITGTSGSLQHAVQVTYQVIPVPDFSLSINTSLQTVKPGTMAAYLIQVSVVPGSGFSGTVNFTVSGQPTNSTTSFTSTSVIVPGSTELDVQTTAQTPASSSTLLITGTSGSLSHGLQPTLEVIPANSDFTLTVSPTSQTIKSADGAIYTAHIGAINGFNGTVNLTLTGLPPFTDLAFGANAPSTGSGDQTIFLFTSSGVTGTFTITITGTSGPLSHTVKVTLIMH